MAPADRLSGRRAGGRFAVLGCDAQEVAQEISLSLNPKAEFSSQTASTNRPQQPQHMKCVLA